jgi:hypothetical protein
MVLIMEARYERVLVIGDSYARDLGMFQERKYSSGYLFVHGSPVEVYGKSGAKIQFVGDSLVEIPHDHYSVIVLMCGSNDLCSSDRCPQLVADDLMSLSRFLINRKGVERVVICEVLRRAKANRHFQISLEYFNQRVVSTNDFLKKECEESTYPIKFWRHDSRVRSSKSLKCDGTHLNEYGLHHLNDSVYRAIWMQLQAVLGIN